MMRGLSSFGGRLGLASPSSPCRGFTTAARGVDCLIAGAGIAGASAAHEIAARGLSVAVLEMESHAGFHATGRSAALFTEIFGPPGVRALSRASRRFLTEAPGTIPGFAPAVPILVPRSTLVVASDGYEEQNKALMLECRNATELESLTPQQACELCPALRRESVAAAFTERGAMDIDVAALHQGYMAAARAAGVDFVADAELLGAHCRAGTWSVRTARGDFEAKCLVNAAGAWGDVVAKRCGIGEVGLVPKLRTAITFDDRRADGFPACDSGSWPFVLHQAVFTGPVQEETDELDLVPWYFAPRPSGYWASLADARPVPPQDAQPDYEDVALLVHRLEAATHFRIDRPLSQWAGLRTFAPDGELCIGADPEEPSFIWCVGQGGYGIHAGPAAAEVTAAAALGTDIPQSVRDCGLDMALVSPGRLRG